MARPVDPLRKPALLEQILDHLLDKPLSSLSFRTLATALGVSTYTLVYQFGSREELIREIVRAISERSGMIEQRLVSSDATLDTYFEGLEISWNWALVPRNRQLQRLEFEAGLLESLSPEGAAAPRSGDESGTDSSTGPTRALFARWQRIGREALEHFGLSAEDAEVESRLIVNTFHGIQYDLVLNRDEAAATAAFRRALDQHRWRIESLLA